MTVLAYRVVVTEGGRDATCRSVCTVNAVDEVCDKWDFDST